MELKEFVCRALTQVIEGVAETSKAAKDAGAAVNPISGYSTKEQIQFVEFDVAVTTEDAASGGGRIAVWGVGLGGEKSAKETTVSHVRFKVPVLLPRQAEP